MVTQSQNLFFTLSILLQFIGGKTKSNDDLIPQALHGTVIMVREQNFAVKFSESIYATRTS